MRLVLLGTGGYHPSAQRHTACLILPELGIVLDAGTAMFRLRDYVQTQSLDIFLTHGHLDHIVGLTFLLSLLHEHPLQRVTVHAAPEKLQAIETHLFAPELFPVEPPFERRPLGQSVELPAGGRLTHFQLQHPGGAVGFRLDWPQRSLAYVTDTTARADATYLPQIRGVDVLVHECYFDDGHEQQAQITGHSCLTPVVQLAAQAQVGRLILTHLSPLAPETRPLNIEAARRIFAATEIGHDELVVDF